MILLSVILLPVLIACSHVTTNKRSKGLSIVTSFYPVYAMTKAVSGDLNDVRMIHSQSGVHSFEPSVRDVASIYDADIFIYHSKTLESWSKDLDANLSEQSVSVLEASENLPLDKVEGLEDVEVGEGVDSSSLYDPHTWTDPILAAQEVDYIAKFLAKKDPKHKQIYQANAESFKTRAKKLTESYQKKFEKTKSKTMVTQHTAFSYLSKRFGLKQLGISGISPEQEPSPRQIAEIKAFVKTYDVKTIFTEDNVSKKTAEVVAKGTGAKIRVLSPLETPPNNDLDYLDNLKLNLDVLYRTLR